MKSIYDGIYDPDLKGTVVKKKESENDTGNENRKESLKEAENRPGNTGRLLGCDENLVDTSSVKEYLDLTEEDGEYPYSRYDLCQMFRIHLNYFRTSLHPLFPYVSLIHTQKRSTDRGFVLNYGPVYLPRGVSRKGFYHYSAKAIEDYIKKNVKVFAKTKRVLLDLYVLDVDEWKQRAKELIDLRPVWAKGENRNSFVKRYQEWSEKAQSLLRNRLPAQVGYILKNAIGPDRRSAYPWVELTDPVLKQKAADDLFAGKWYTPADRDYGVDMQDGCRRIHMQGWLRLELPVHDAPDMVRYIPDPFAQKKEDWMLFEITLTWDDWLKFNDKLHQ